MRRLSLGFGIGGSVSGLSAAFSVSIGSGSFTTGTLLTASVSGLQGGEVVTYQWQDDGVNITGATASTYTAAIGTDGIADASQIRVVITVDGGDPISSPSRQIQYAAGTAPAVADGQSWTVDDTAVSLDGSASGANLTFSYALADAAVGVTINSGSGLITGTPTAVDSGTTTITATDQYGRQYQDTFTYSTALRTQATAASGLGPFNWTVDDTDAATDATTDFTLNGNTLSYVITGLPAGVVDDGDGTWSGTPTAVGSGTITITGTDEYGRDTISTASYTNALRAQATGGVDLDLSFDADATPIPSTDLTQNWTVGNNTLTLVSVSPTLPSGLSVNSTGALSGTPVSTAADATYTLMMQDEYSRQTSDTFTLELVTPSAAPSLDTLTFTDNNDGTPATLSLTYSGNVTGYRVYIATGSAAFDSDVPTASELYAGSGATGALEYADYAIGSDIDITGLTGTSNTAVRIAAGLIKSADGSDPSNIRVVTVSGLDFTAPVLSLPTATAASATSITAGVTSDEANGTIYFAARLATNPALSISDIENGTGNAVSTGTDATPTADANNAATLTGLAQGTAYIVDSFQRDQDGNESAVVSSASETTWDVPDAFVDADWSVATGSGSGELDVTITSLPAANGSAITDVEYELDASGTWVSSGGTVSFTITATASTSYDVRLRAVNAVGNSAAGNTETATSGAGASNTTSYTDTDSTTTGAMTGSNPYDATVDIGTAAANRRVIIPVVSITSNAPTSVVINPATDNITATAITGADVTIASQRIIFYEAIVASGTTCVVRLTYASAPSTAALHAAVVYGKTADTGLIQTDVGVRTDMDLTFTAVGGEDVIAVALTGNGLTWSGGWVGVTEEFPNVTPGVNGNLSTGDVRSNEYTSVAIAENVSAGSLTITAVQGSAVSGGAVMVPFS